MIIILFMKKEYFYFVRKHAYGEVDRFSIFDDIFDNFDFFFTIFYFSPPNKIPIFLKIYDVCDYMILKQTIEGFSKQFLFLWFFIY